MNNLIAQKFTNPVVGSTLKGLETGDSGEFLNTFLPKGIGLVFIFGSLSFFFMILWGAVTWILSGGDKAAVESSRARITNSVIGFVVLLSSFAIVKIIELFFNINILSIDIGPLTIQ